jgi:(R,R)-butanediol dehydrogenase/meso-butanediol dehydrogenase/diacetyl reductase
MVPSYTHVYDPKYHRIQRSICNDKRLFARGNVRAAVFRAVGELLAIESRPDPEPAPGEVIIKVDRCGICSSDLHMTSGLGFTYPVNSILGHEYAGEVTELGASVSRLRIGDRITALPMTGCGKCAECVRGFPLGCPTMAMMMSGYAQYARVAEPSAVKLPASLTFADGALVEPLACSLRGASMSGLRAGSRLVILGAGPIGLGAMFWARQMGAGRIVAVARTKRHADLAMHMGATHFLTQGPDLARNVGELLGGPPEAVLECIGMPGSLSLAVELVAPRGTVVVLGMCMLPDTITPFIAGFKSVVMRFSAGYELRDFEAAVEVMDRGAFEPRAMVSETIVLDDLPRVFEQMRNHTQGCKTLVQPFA